MILKSKLGKMLSLVDRVWVFLVFLVVFSFTKFNSTNIVRVPTHFLLFIYIFYSLDYLNFIFR